MPLASLPGPVSAVWHLGPISVHGYAVCAVAGIVVLLMLTERRYRAAGGSRLLIIDFATLAVPVGLIGARIYRILIDYPRYFGPGKDWVGVLRVWDGGFGLPGAAIAGLLVVWFWCRRKDLAIGPVLAAAAPGIAFGAAISLVGNWFSQSLYGAPSSVPWAVPIAPASRLAGYQDFATFQPLFGYEAIWDAAVGVALIYLIRRLNLTGDRALAICIAGYAVGVLGAESFVLAGPQQHSDLVIKQIAALAVLVAAGIYLYASRSKLGPEPLTVPPRRGRPLLGGPMLEDDDAQPGLNASRTASFDPRGLAVAVEPLVPQQAGLVDSADAAGSASPVGTGNSGNSGNSGSSAGSGNSGASVGSQAGGAGEHAGEQGPSWRDPGCGSTQEEPAQGQSGEGESLGEDLDAGDASDGAPGGIRTHT